MKKYFSLIAVSMFAVASVFTSCDKNDAGSSYNPEVVSTTSKSQQMDIDKSIRITTDGTGDANALAAEIQSMLQSKVGDVATVSVSPVNITFATDDYSALIKAMGNVTNSDFDNIASKYPGFTIKVKYALNGTTVINYTNVDENAQKSDIQARLTAGFHTGTWKATVDGHQYEINVTNNLVNNNCSSNYYEATLTVDGEQYKGTVHVVLRKTTSYMAFLSDAPEGSVSKYMMDMNFSGNNTDSFTADLNLNVRTSVFEDAEFTK